MLVWDEGGARVLGDAEASVAAIGLATEWCFACETERLGGALAEADAYVPIGEPDRGRCRLLEV